MYVRFLDTINVIIGKLYLSKVTILSGSKIAAVKTNIENAQNKIEQYQKSLEEAKKKKVECQTVIQTVSEQIGGYKSIADYSKGSYYINKNQIYHTSKKHFLKKETTQLIIPNIQDIIWCYQWHDNDDYYVDFHTLSLYLLNSRKPIDIQLGASSADSVFDIVLPLKENVPHLLYCPNSEYEKLFDRSPAELMTLAKSKINN